MQLFHFLVVIISLSCGSLPAAGDGLMLPLGATVGLVLLWSLLCHLAAATIFRQVRIDQLDPYEAARWLEKQLEVFRWLSLAIVVICLAGFGLSGAIESTPVFRDSMFLQSLVLLAPGVIMTVASWSAEQMYGSLLGYTSPGIKNYTRSLWTSFRSSIGWLIAPVLLLMIIADLIGLMPLGEAAGTWITGLIVVAFVLLGIPVLIRKLFKTESLDTETETWITSLMQAAGIRRIRSARWDSGNKTFNAMVAGFIGRYRTLIVSDRLLDELPREQVAMVVLHEAAHLKRYHVPLRMAAIMPAWIGAIAVSKLAGDSEWATMLGSIAGIAFTLLILRVVAYRCERDADVQACKLAEKLNGKVPFVPTSFESASEALGDALTRVTSEDASSRKASWLHPSISDRINWMRRQRALPISSTSNAGTIANPA